MSIARWKAPRGVLHASPSGISWAGAAVSVADPDPTIHRLSELVPASVVWAIIGAAFATVGTLLWYFARRDRANIDSRFTANEERLKKIENETVTELFKRINETERDLAGFRDTCGARHMHINANVNEFKAFVSERYVSAIMLDRHIVEPLRRIERKLDEHIGAHEHKDHSD